MKRLFILSFAGAFLMTLSGLDLAWAITHVPIGKVQVCHKGKTITVSERALKAHLGHGDCQLPACDLNNVFLAGDACDGVESGLCDFVDRDSTEGLTDACPAGTF